MKNVKADIALKDFFRNPVNFASIVNATLFYGIDKINAKDVLELDTEESMILGLNEQDQKLRNLIKKVKIDDSYVLIGMEFQDKLQRNMPIRIDNYDLLRYLKYLKLAKKVDPIVTMTIFTGEKKWKNPKNIYGFLKKIPNDFKQYIPDWWLNFYDLKDLDCHLIHDKDTRALIENIQIIYRIKKNLNQMPKDIVMTKEFAIVVSAVTKFPKLLELVNQSKEGDEIHMCEALRMMEKCSRDEGIRIGEKRGIKKEKANTKVLQRKNVQTMLSKGFEISIIAECLSLTESQVKKYAKPMPVQ